MWIKLNPFCPRRLTSDNIEADALGLALGAFIEHWQKNVYPTLSSYIERKLFG